MNNLELQRALVALGDTPEQVYLTLKQKGVTGNRTSFCNCPLANYLKDRYQPTFISVTGRRVTLDECSVYSPEAVRLFISNFDAGFEYQDLLEKT